MKHLILWLVGLTTFSIYPASRAFADDNALQPVPVNRPTTSVSSSSSSSRSSRVVKRTTRKRSSGSSSTSSSDPNALQVVVVAEDDGVYIVDDTPASGHVTSTTVTRRVVPSVRYPGETVHRPVQNVYVESGHETVYVPVESSSVYAPSSSGEVYVVDDGYVVDDSSPSYTSGGSLSSTGTNGFLSPSTMRWYLQAAGSYAGLRSDVKGTPVFTGLALAATAGVGINYFSLEFDLEMSNHWLKDQPHKGYPSGHNLYSWNLGIKGILPLWFVEPYLRFSVGAILYHPSDSIKYDGDRYDWGFTGVLGIGVQLHFRNFAFGGGYSHRWARFGEQTNSAGDVTELRLQVSRFDVHFSYYFNLY